MIKNICSALILSAAFMTSACAEGQTEDSEMEVNPTFEAPDSAWRDLDQNDALYIQTDYGLIIVELYPEIAPGHVERIKTLASSAFYDNVLFHRVVTDFMNQTGDPAGDGTGDSPYPDLEAEFTFRRGMDMPVELVTQIRKPKGSGFIDAGFYKALPVATKPDGAAFATIDQKVEAYGLHCKGVTSMARTEIPNSANSQFFLMRGKADHLDTQYSIWGSTVFGRENLTKISVGAVGETEGFIPDAMRKVRMGSDLDAEEQMQIQILKTDSPEFDQFIENFKTETGDDFDICDVEIPTRIKP